MKKFLFALLLVSASFVAENSFSMAPVYLTFTTHNEDAEPYQIYNYYIARRNFVVQLANMLQGKNIKWDFQSDWKFLQAVKNFDTGNVVQNTNGKNLLKWLVEDRGISCDPHSHEANGYNYADVAYLHEQLNIIPTKIVGGFIYNQIIGGNNWENLETGIYGRVYTSYFWKPDILWGGGTPGHINDPQNYGAWKPQSMANFYIHDSTKHLTLIGNGCSNKIYDTTAVSTVVQRIRNIVDAVQYHVLPDTGFYTTTVHSQIADLNNPQIIKIMQFIDSVQTFVNEGKVVWKSIEEIYNTWNTTYNKKPFWVGCSQLPAVYSFYNIKFIPEGLYNEISNSLNLQDVSKAYLRNVSSPYSVADSSQSEIDSISFNSKFAFVNANSGIYYIQLKHRNSIETWSKPGGESFTRGGTMNFDFTSGSAQAYGSNMKLKGSKYCIYSGDVGQDGAVDISDIVSIHNDAANFASGYMVTDLDGNFSVDISDILIAYNNAINFVAKVTP